MEHLVKLLTEYGIMGGRRSDDPAVDDDEFDFNQPDSSCSECGFNEDDDEFDNVVRGHDDEMEPDMDAGGDADEPDMGMDAGEPDMGPDMGGGDAGMDMDADPEMGMDDGPEDDVEARLDDLEDKLTTVLQKFAQVIAQDMSNDMDGAEDDLGMDDDPDAGEDDLGMDDPEMGAGEEDPEMGADADMGGDMGGGPDMGDGDVEKETDEDPFDDEHPEFRNKVSRMRNSKEINKLLMSGKYAAGMSFKEAMEAMRQARLEAAQ